MPLKVAKTCTDTAPESGLGTAGWSESKFGLGRAGGGSQTAELWSMDPEWAERWTNGVSEHASVTRDTRWQQSAAVEYQMLTFAYANA